MAKKKKKDMLEDLVDMMLEKHNSSYQYVLENPIIEGEPWYLHYTWTKEEEEEYKKKAIEMLTKKYKLSVKMSKQSLLWILLDVGLRTVEE